MIISKILGSVVPDIRAGGNLTIKLPLLDKRIYYGAAPDIGNHRSELLTRKTPA